MKKIDVERIKAVITQNPKPIAIVAGVLLISSLYMFSKREESQVIVYKNDKAANFENTRVIGATDDVYQRKNQVLRGRLKTIESSIDKLIGTIKSHRLEIEERFQALEKSMGETSKAPTSGINLLPSVSPVSPKLEIPTENDLNPRFSSSHSPVKLEPVTQQVTPKASSKGPTTISFPIQGTSPKEITSIALPAGSFVKAKNLTGVEAPEGKALPILMQLDYAFVGPNKTKIDLSGCFMIAKSTGNLSIERAEIQTTKLSCVSRSGRSFERKINGFVADDKDNSFGMIGEINSKQDNVAAMAFLSSIVEGVSSAVAQAQMTQSTNATGGSTSILTGDQGKYLGASGASNAASTVTQWYLRHAQNLLPTINIGSGMDVWVVMQDGVDLPNWYFKAATKKEDQNFRFLSRFAE